MGLDVGAAASAAFSTAAPPPAGDEVEPGAGAVAAAAAQGMAEGVAQAAHADEAEVLDQASRCVHPLVCVYLCSSSNT